MPKQKADVGLDLDELRRRLRARGLTISQFATEARMYESNVSAILGGRMYLGSEVRGRIEAAMARLGLDRDEDEA
ncbi:MAG TPA: hypothetical protein VE338_16625 [Ktedonobacterales bacterium]|jgi:transcriptional regulator with XRE-family HTH domain|nr:hypothetical protein [Ktedonobacterales bacterium]